MKGCSRNRNLGIYDSLIMRRTGLPHKSTKAVKVDKKVTRDPLKTSSKSKIKQNANSNIKTAMYSTSFKVSKSDGSGVGEDAGKGRGVQE